MKSFFRKNGSGPASTIEGIEVLEGSINDDLILQFYKKIWNESLWKGLECPSLQSKDFEAHLERLRTPGDARIMIMRDEGNPIGAVVYFRENGEIRHLFLPPKYRRPSLVSKVLNRVITQLSEDGHSDISIKPTNSRPLRLTKYSDPELISSKLIDRF